MIRRNWPVSFERLLLLVLGQPPARSNGGSKAQKVELAINRMQPAVHTLKQLDVHESCCKACRNAEKVRWHGLDRRDVLLNSVHGSGVQLQF